MAGLSVRKKGNESVLAFMIEKNTVRCISWYRGQDIRHWSKEFPHESMNEVGGLLEPELIHSYFQQAVQELGVPDVLVGVVPNHLTQLMHYEIPAKTELEQEAERLAVRDSQFIRKTDANNFETEPVVVFKQLWDADEATEVVDAVCVAFPQQLVDTYLEVAERIERPLAMIDAAEFAYFRYLWRSNIIDDVSFGLVRNDKTFSSVIYVHEGVPKYRRVLQVGQDQVKDSLASQRLARDIDDSLQYFETRHGIDAELDTYVLLTPAEGLLYHYKNNSTGLNVRDVTPSVAEEYSRELVDGGYLPLLIALATFQGEYEDEYFADYAEFEYKRTSNVPFLGIVSKAFPWVLIASLIWSSLSFFLVLSKAKSTEELLLSSEEQIRTIDQRIGRNAGVRELESQLNDIASVINHLEYRMPPYPEYLTHIVESLTPEITLSNVALEGHVWRSKLTATNFGAITDYLKRLDTSRYFDHVDYTAISESDAGYSLDLIVRFSQ